MENNFKGIWAGKINKHWQYTHKDDFSMMIFEFSVILNITSSAVKFKQKVGLKNSYLANCTKDALSKFLQTKEPRPEYFMR